MSSVDLYEGFALVSDALNLPAQFAGHHFESLTRPQQSILSRVKSCAYILLCFPFIIPGTLLSISSSILSRCLQKDRIKLEANDAGHPANEKLRILFCNICLQGGPFAAMTGGVASLHEKFIDQFPSRTDAIVQLAKQSGANVLCFSEVHHLSSMNALQEKLRKQGFTYFIKDVLTHPVFVNSGLFIASKKKISNPKFVSFPYRVRSGVHLGAEQGCITFDVHTTNKKVIKVAFTHLNYGSNPKNQRSRELQLQRIFKSLPEKGISILGGDFNYEYKKALGKLQSLAGNRTFASLLPNVPTTRVTFENGGHVRGKKKSPEVIDAALLLNDQERHWKTTAVKPRINNGRNVTDHFGILVEEK